MIAAPRIVRRAVADDTALSARWHPVTRRVLAARGIADEQALDSALAGLHAPELLGGLERASELVAATMAAGGRILVVGDFDADGATSTALAVRALRAMGAPDTDFLVPNRFEYGYGLTPEIVELAATRAPALIITVDNGVSSVAGVAAAQSRGIRVLVTDHHLPGADLPAADAMVNPNLPGDAFPSKALAGVGVIFYVMTALRARLRESGWFAARGLAEPRLADLLDLVALGTVADVVPLDHNNRRLVAQGLARIRAGRCQPGIAALVDAAGRRRARLVASDLGFALGPRLNAAGRLADMSVGIECLLSDDPHRCAAIADELNRLNQERREIEQEMRDHAFELIEAALPADHAALPAAFCLYHEDWHQGVVGIVAARVKDRFHRPAIAFARGEGDELKGSARSIGGVHVRDVLDLVATRNPGLVSRFGGHAMAAGLSLPAAHLDEFERAFVDTVDAQLDPALRHKALESDGELAADEFNLDLARELAEVAPWGQGFPEPRFDGAFDVVDRRVVGRRHARLVLRPPGTADTVAAIAFGAADEPWYRGAARIHAYYKLDVNDYGGIDTLQLVVDHVRPID
ncbi:MAG: single-stranded-DNA-specific exonuclease RecJ [Gammaproteobacteria bacterium]